MPFETTWIELESIMLSEISQTKTNTVSVWDSLIRGIYKTNEQTQQNRNVQKIEWVRVGEGKK